MTGTLGPLAELHQRIGSCQRCCDLLDPSKATRRMEATPLHASLFIVSQALASETQRRSGVPYFYPDGSLSSTGRRLEEFLVRIGSTLYPRQAVTLDSGPVASARPGLNSAYNSEIIQCFPGRTEGQQGDRFPAQAARQCLAQGYLIEEIRLVDPEVILVLGRQATRYFLEEVGAPASRRVSLTESLEDIQAGGSAPWVSIAGRQRLVVPLIHPSGMTTGRFRRLVLDNAPLERLIHEALRAVRNAARQGL